jgi:hypothetical protein
MQAYNENRTTKLTIRFTEQERKQLEALAATRGMKLS